MKRKLVPQRRWNQVLNDAGRFRWNLQKDGRQSLSIPTVQSGMRLKWNKVGLKQGTDASKGKVAWPDKRAPETGTILSE